MLDDDFYKPDPEEPGSWIDLYWWRVIIGMVNEWEADKYKRDDSGKRQPDPDGLTRRPKNAPRKKPRLLSEKNHRGRS
jgi:hypothetical protein